MLGSRPITLRSSLDPVAIAHKLQAALPATPAGEGVYGNGSQYEMHLTYYRPRYRNDLQSRLDADLVADGAGTRIEGRLGAPRGGMMFMGCWIGFVSVFLLGGLTALAATRSVIALPFVGVPLMMLGIGSLILWGGRGKAARDEAAILAFLKDTIGAQPV